MARPKKRNGIPRTCPNCGGAVSGHPNKKYCSRTCSVDYWETVAPGKLAYVSAARKLSARGKVISSGLTRMLDEKVRQLDNPIEIDNDSPWEYDGPHDC